MQIQRTQAVTHSCGREAAVLAAAPHGMQGKGPASSGRAVLSHCSLRIGTPCRATSQGDIRFQCPHGSEPD